MPKIGDQRMDGNYRKDIWLACESCGKERWISRQEPIAKRCISCANRDPKKRKQLSLAFLGNKSCKWKGGRSLHRDGYIYVWLETNDFFFSMATRRRLPEHRLIMAKHLGRCLQEWEIVHHKNGIKDDNRFENLELTSSLGEHSKAHSKGYRDGYQKGLIDGHEKRIKDLEARITLLEADLALSRVMENIK